MDGRSWAAVVAPLCEHGEQGSPFQAQLSTNSAPADAMQKTFLEEQVTLMRAELRGLVTSKLEEMVTAQLTMKESVNGLMERFGSFMERAETALDRLSMASVVVQRSPVSPPTFGFVDGGVDRGLELYGCFSPRETTNSASILALVSECVAPMMQDMPNLQERVGFDITSHEEQNTMGYVEAEAMNGEMQELLPCLGPLGQ